MRPGPELITSTSSSRSSDARRVRELGEPRFLREAELDRIGRVVVHQALDDVMPRPLQQFEPDAARRLELERPRGGQLHGPPDPDAARVQARERLAAMAAVDDGAEARAGMRRRGRCEHRLGDERLEIRDPRIVGAAGGRELLHLAAMVEGEDAEVARQRGVRSSRDAARRCARPSSGRAGVADAAEEFLELGARRHRRRAAVAGDDDGAGRIAAPAAVRGGQALDPAAQVSGQEGIAGAEDVQHLDRESADDEPLVDARRDRPLEHHATGDPALHDDGRAGARADRPQRLERARPAARDADLLLGADDEVAVGQEFLHLPRHFGRALLALGAAAVAGEAPEHRPVVDVEHDL